MRERENEKEKCNGICHYYMMRVDVELWRKTNDTHIKINDAPHHHPKSDDERASCILTSSKEL